MRQIKIFRMSMTRLSVNINKIATLRNSRGGNVPDLLEFARACERFGAQGITVHPRPDERHIRKADVYDLKKVITTEFNIEGNPTEEFVKLICDIRPQQVTLVPDAVSQLTSDHGWDTFSNQYFLQDVIAQLHESGARVSVFVDPMERMVDYAARAGADRVELYTGPYAREYERDGVRAATPYKEAALCARECGIGLNAGHGLTTENLPDLLHVIPWVDEVSIGHQLIADALYWGIENTIKRYLDCCRQ